MTVELKVRFPVDDAELSLLHHRAFSPDRPDRPDQETTIAGWAQRPERHSLTTLYEHACGFRRTPAGLRRAPDTPSIERSRASPGRKTHAWPAGRLRTGVSVVAER